MGETQETRSTDNCSAGAWRKHYLQLDAAYRSDFLKLDIQEAVTSSKAPLLVIHGGSDQSVPIPNGEALFAAAAEPKHWLAIAKGNHLLKGSKDVQKAAKAICELAKRQL